jgi:hypothetical protein
VNIDVYAALVRCVDAQFDGGVTMRVTKAVIVAERAFFGAPSSIAPSRIFGSYELELQWLPAWEGEREAAGLGGQWPALVSLHGTDVSNLVLVDTDLSLCVFADAHRLDQLRIEGYCHLIHHPVVGDGRGGRFFSKKISGAGIDSILFLKTLNGFRPSG